MHFHTRKSYLTKRACVSHGKCTNSSELISSFSLSHSIFAKDWAHTMSTVFKMKEEIGCQLLNQSLYWDMCITKSALGVDDLTGCPSLTLMSAARPSAAPCVSCIPGCLCTARLWWNFAVFPRHRETPGPSVVHHGSPERCNLHVLSVFLN